MSINVDVEVSLAELIAMYGSDISLEEVLKLQKEREKKLENEKTEKKKYKIDVSNLDRFELLRDSDDLSVTVVESVPAMSREPSSSTLNFSEKDKDVRFLEEENALMREKRNLVERGFFNAFNASYSWYLFNENMDFGMSDPTYMADIVKSFGALRVLGRPLKVPKAVDYQGETFKNTLYRILYENRNVSTLEKAHVDKFANYLYITDVDELERNSYSFFKELNAECDFSFVPSSNTASVFYTGPDSKKFRDYLSLFGEECEYMDTDLNIWRDAYSSEYKSGCYYEDLDERLEFVASKSKLEFVLNDVVCTAGPNIHLDEFCNSYNLFKHLFISFKHLNEGGNMVIRIAPYFQNITCEILALFCPQFKQYKMFFPITASMYSEDVYIVFKSKFENVHCCEKSAYINTMDKYFEVYNDRNLKNLDQTVVITNLLNDEQKKHLGEYVEYFKKKSKDLQEYLKNRYNDIVHALNKNPKYADDVREELSMRYTSNISSKVERLMDLYVGSKATYHAIPEVQNIYTVDLDDLNDDEMVQQETVLRNEIDTNIRKTKLVSPVTVVKAIVESENNLRSFPSRPIYTNYGKLHDMVVEATRIAYDREYARVPDEDMKEVAKFTNIAKTCLLKLFSYNEKVVDLGCGKGSDLAKYFTNKYREATFIDISKKQLGLAVDNNVYSGIKVNTIMSDITELKILPGMEAYSLVTMFHTFNTICSSKALLINWLKTQLRYNDMVLLGTFLSDTVLKNSEYLKKFKCKVNGNLLRFSIPGLVTDAYEYCINEEELKNTINIALFKCHIVPISRFIPAAHEISESAYSLMKDLRVIIVYDKHKTVANMGLNAALANINNRKLVFNSDGKYEGLKFRPKLVVFEGDSSSSSDEESVRPNYLYKVGRNESEDSLGITALRPNRRSMNVLLTQVDCGGEFSYK